MKTYAIWKNHVVIGYINLTEEQRQTLNGTDGIDVYFGFDKVTRPDISRDDKNKELKTNA